MADADGYCIRSENDYCHYSVCEKEEEESMFNNAVYIATLQ